MFKNLSTFSYKNRLNNKIAVFLWLLIAVFCALQSLLTHRYNNYLIFENTFLNLIHHRSLYAAYPLVHFDTNHYGPVFGVFFMPFALMTKTLGLLVWDIANYALLIWAISTIPLKNKSLLLYIAIPCVISSALSEQFNPIAAAFIILSYTQLNKSKGLWSAMFIMLGTFIKLYGIVGLAFFFFVKNKKQFIAYLALWAAVFFVLPMLFSSPSFILHTYNEWANSLIEKNEINVVSATSDISIMGFFRNLLDNYNLSNTMFLGVGALLFLLPFVNVSAYKSQYFQLYILGSALLFPVLFSTGSEDCTYIIAISAVGIWYLFSKKQFFDKFLLGTTILFSCNFPLLFFSQIVDTYPILLSMLSLPFFIVWVIIIYKAFVLKEKQFNSAAT